MSEVMWSCHLLLERIIATILTQRRTGEKAKENRAMVGETHKSEQQRAYKRRQETSQISQRVESKGQFECLDNLQTFRMSKR